MCTLAKSVDTDEMQHNGLHCLLKLKQPSGTEIYHNLENSTCDPYKIFMSNMIFNWSVIHRKFKSVPYPIAA